MKRFKKWISLATAAALMLAPGLFGMKAEAANPTTFYLKYDTDKNQWRMQIGEWLEDYEGREVYYLNSGEDRVKDGDVIVVLENEEQAAGSTGITVNAHLSNLTVNRSSVVIATNGIDNCYVLGDSYAAVSGNVTNGYVYDNGICTFNNNVQNLYLISSTEPRVRTTVSVKGTVGYCCVQNQGGIMHQYYNFVADTFYYDHASSLMTKDWYWSRYPDVPAVSQPDPNAALASDTAGSAVASPDAQAAQPASQPAATSSNSGEYDDVPKTSDNRLAVWMFVCSALCLAGCAAFRRCAEN